MLSFTYAASPLEGDQSQKAKVSEGELGKAEVS